MEGLVRKKSPSGLSVFELWQTRYLVIVPKMKLCYYYKNKPTAEKDENGVYPSGSELGQIELDLVQDVIITPFKQNRVFVLVLSNGRRYQFQTKSNEETQKWLACFNKNCPGLTASMSSSQSSNQSKISSLNLNTPPSTSPASTSPREHRESTHNIVQHSFWKKSLSKESIDTILKSTPFGCFLPAEDLEALGTCFVKAKYPAGKIISQYTDSEIVHGGNSKRKKNKTMSLLGLSIEESEVKFIFVLKGEIELSVKNKVFTTKREGDFIPMLRYVSDVYTARAVSNAIVIEMEETRFNNYLLKHDTHRDLVSILTGYTLPAFLQLSPIFKGVQLKDMYILSCLLHWVSLEAGEMLFEEGSLGTSLYVLVNGSVSARVIDTGNETAPDPEDLKGLARSNSSRNSRISSKTSFSKSNALKDSSDNLYNMMNDDKDNKDNNDNNEKQAPKRKPPRKSVIFKVGSSIRNRLINTHNDKMITRRIFKESGEFFGEIGLRMNIPRTASIYAEEKNNILFEFTKTNFETFQDFVPNDTYIRSVAQRSVAEQFRRFDVPFFQAIPPDKFALLSKLSTVSELPEGHVIVRQDEIGDSFHMIAYGRVSVTINVHVEDNVTNTTHIEQKEVAVLTRGMYFGEIALVLDTPRTATVTCLERCVLFSINRKNFNIFFHHAPVALADFELKLSPLSVQLRTILYHPIGVQYFTKQLALEYSLENIHFWMAINVFREITWKVADENYKLKKAAKQYEFHGNIARLCKKIAETSLPEDIRTNDFHINRLGKLLDVDISLASDLTTTLDQIISIVKLYNVNIRQDVMNCLMHKRRYVELEKDYVKTCEGIRKHEEKEERKVMQLRFEYFFELLDENETGEITYEILYNATQRFFDLYQISKHDVKMLFGKDVVWTIDDFLAKIANVPSDVELSLDQRWLRKLQLVILNIDFSKWLLLFKEHCDEDGRTMSLNTFLVEIVSPYFFSKSENTTKRNSLGKLMLSDAEEDDDDDEDDDDLKELQADLEKNNVELNVGEFNEKLHLLNLNSIITKEILTYNEYFTFIINELRRQNNLQEYLYMEMMNIYNEYISTNAPSMVNITSQQRMDLSNYVNSIIEQKKDDTRLFLDENNQQVNNNYINIDLNMFDVAQLEIMKLMDTDSYSRFKVSSLFQDFLSEIGVKSKYLIEKKRSMMTPTSSVPPSRENSKNSSGYTTPPIVDDDDNNKLKVNIIPPSGIIKDGSISVTSTANATPRSIIKTVPVSKKKKKTKFLPESAVITYSDGC